MHKISADASIPIAADGEPMVLGAQKFNPYTVANMAAALAELDAQGIVSEKPFSVRLTHRYIKYKPSNEGEYDALTTDTNLVFYDYPLDYEVLVQGNYYHDPAIPDSLPTPQYVVVPDGYSYNTAVSHEVLAELYLPEEDVQLLGTGLNENLGFGNSLLENAFGRGNIFLEPANPHGDMGNGTVSIPQRTGTIRVFDNRLNQFIPLQGAEVTAKRGFTTRKGRVNAAGNYTLDGDPFNRPADYAIKFNRGSTFIINNRHAIRPAKVVRHDISGNTWSHDIIDGTDRMHATMFRAAFRYYGGNVGGLRRPFNPNGRQDITSKQRRNGGAMNWIVFPNIVVAQRADGMSGREYDTDEIFSTTIHELAHTAHVATMNNAADYANVSRLIQESWATGVEWFITRMEYQERGIANYMEWDYRPGTPHDTAIIQPILHGYQFWRMQTSDKYTSLFINLVDDFNDSNGWTGRPNDQVSGYNLATIQANYLRNMYAASSLQNQLNNNRPTGVSTAQLNLLLSFY